MSFTNWWLHALNPVLHACGSECLHFWEVIGVWVTGLTTFGAIVTSLYLAQQGERIRIQERITKECGKANRLITILGRTLGMLEDLKETLFDGPARQLGRMPQWNEMGGFQGLPTRVPRVEVADYDFLLETIDPRDRGAEVLGHIEHVQTLVDSIMAMLHERTDCAYRLQEIGPVFGRGEGAISSFNSAGILQKRLKDLTDGLASDIPEAISKMKSVIPQLRVALEARYPGRQFLLLIPSNPKDPAL